MVNAKRRIRKLELRASNDDDVRRGALILEDAFHVASLPEIGGRLLIVRSLDVGRFRHHSSSATMALAIEERIRQLLPAAVYAHDAAASISRAVFFQSASEPYVSLIGLLARGQRVDQWFWPLAVPAWQPSMPVAEALSRLVLIVTAQECGIAAAASVVRKLVEHGGFASLLSALRWQDGVALLRSSGWKRPDLPSFLLNPDNEWQDLPGLDAISDSFAGQPVSSKWLPELARAVAAWGPDDPRTTWLVAVALVAEKPARSHDAHITFRAQRLTRFLMDWAGSPRRRVEASNIGATGASKVLPAAEPVSDEPQVKASEEPVSHTSLLRRDEVSGPAPGTPETFEAGEAGRLGDSSNVSVEDRGHAEAQPRLFARPTEFAGLYFLISLMSRLGIATVLESNSALIEWELPERVLDHISRLLRIGRDDPVLPGGKLREGIAPADFTFIAPELWVERLAAGTGFVIGRVDGVGRWRILLDGSGRLPLALWKGRAAHGIRDLFQRPPVRRRSEVDDGAHLILSGWTNAMRRYLRRHARIGLSEIVRRPGRVSVTRTHIDIVLNNDDADPRIRKAGLDLNPGWVPWLGRVVTFHYRYGGI
ncbi:MAG TPA: hypothetical protein VFV34_08935 [Blastocatellia bacterium]|nr:hypothetical protein [Blastocatellia bacterium]